MKTSTPGPFDAAAVGGPPVSEPVNRLVSAVGSVDSAFDAAALIRWQDWYSFLPMAGSILAVIGFWCSSTRNIRRFNLPGVALWLIYGIMTASISAILCNVFSIISILIAEIKEPAKKDGKA